MASSMTPSAVGTPVPDTPQPSGSTYGFASSNHPTSAAANASREPDLEVIVNALQSDSVSLAQKITYAAELRDGVDQIFCSNAAQTKALEMLMPACIAILSEQTNPSWARESPQTRYRSLLIAIIQRLPVLPSAPEHPARTAFLPSLFDLITRIINEDNEEMGVVAIKILIDMVRAHKTECDVNNGVSRLLATIQGLYHELGSTIDQIFGDEHGELPPIQQNLGKAAHDSKDIEMSSPLSSSSPSADSNIESIKTRSTAHKTTDLRTDRHEREITSGKKSAAPKSNDWKVPEKQYTEQYLQENLLPSRRSFKVLTECPIAIVCILQAFPSIAEESMNNLAPLAVQCINNQAKPQRLAHELAAAQGLSCFTISKSIIKRSLFVELISAQVKLVSLIVYTVRNKQSRLDDNLTAVAAGCIRLLKDCPYECSSARKELLVAVRHIMSNALRAAFTNHIDDLLDERLLIGRGITTRETLKSMAVSFLQDLVISIREKLSPAQLLKAIDLYLQWMHDPSLTVGVHLQCVKLVISLIERVNHAAGLSPPAIGLNQAQELNVRIIHAFVDRLKALRQMKDDLIDSGHLEFVASTEEKDSNKPTDMGENLQNKPSQNESPSVAQHLITATVIEQSKPIAGALSISLMSDPVKDSRSLFRMILQGLLWLMKAYKQMSFSAPVSVEIMSRIFKYGFECFFGISDRSIDREGSEALEFLITLLQQTDALTFQAIITNNFEAFFEAAVHHTQAAMYACKLLLTKEPTQVFLGIMLNFLVENLDKVGGPNQGEAQLIIHLYRLVFSAIQADGNEKVLVPHLEYILLTSLKLASRADTPVNYYTLLRHLSNAIGGGRFEAFHAVVQPLLTTYLNNLRVLLDGAKPSERDPLILLFLILPVRLQLIIPYLHFLIRPLCMAIKESGNEVIAQGLRTLELCIDNLNPVYLDPIFAPFYQDLQSGLWQLLKPSIAQHSPFANHAMTILGKLGGRNRKQIHMPPQIAYQSVSEDLIMWTTFIGSEHRKAVSLTQTVRLATKTIVEGSISEKKDAFEILKYSTLLLYNQQIRGKNREELYEAAVSALFLAPHTLDSSEEAVEFICQLADTVLALDTSSSSFQPRIVPATAIFLDAMTQSLADIEHADLVLSRQIFLRISKALMDRSRDSSQASPEADSTKQASPSNAMLHFDFILHQIASRSSALCHDALWSLKSAGLRGINLLLFELDIDIRWTILRQVEFMRAAFFMLKDMHTDPTKDFDDAIKMLKQVITMCHSPEARREENQSTNDRVTTLAYVVTLLMSELTSVKAIARRTAQECLALVASLNDKEVPALLAPTQKTLSMSIFSKPLRALPVPMQTARIDAVTYCLTLTPPILDQTEELIRFVMEVLGIAEAEDSAHIGKTPNHSWTIALEDLRVAAIKLLAAATAFPEDLNAQLYVRTKIITVYFKYLTSKSPDLVSASQRGIQQVLAQVGKVPKELLQSALKPILVHLADSKSITLEALNSLARLLELLPNYFRREIGSKLLEHFQSLLETILNSISQSLTYGSNMSGANIGAFNSIQDIEVMAAIVKIFGLLPSSSNIYLERLISLVAEANHKLKRDLDSPFTKPLSLFLSRNARESNEIFLKAILNGSCDHWITTYVHALAEDSAQALRDDLLEHSEALTALLSTRPSPSVTLAGLQIVHALVKHDNTLLDRNVALFAALTSFWDIHIQLRDGKLYQEYYLLLEIWKCHLAHSIEPRLCFSLLQIYQAATSLNLTNFTRYTYDKICRQPSPEARKNFLSAFIQLAEDTETSQELKLLVLRYIINPLLLFTFEEMKDQTDVIDAVMINELQTKIWAPVLDEKYRTSYCSNNDLLIELLHMASLLIKNCAELIAQNDAKKILIRFAWVGVIVEEAAVRQVAYIMVGRFVEAYETPLKIVLQSFISLLRVHQSEHKGLVRQALDIFAPCMPKRCPVLEHGSHSVWAIWCRRVINEDSQSVSQLNNIYQLIVRHPDLFFPSRELFVPAMVNALPKLGFASSATHETRSFAIEMLELILKWEQERSQNHEQQTSKGPMTETAVGEAVTGIPQDADKDTRPLSKRPRLALVSSAQGSSDDSPAPENSSPRDYTASGAVRGQVISYLVRYICNSGEPLSRQGSTQRAISLLNNFMSIGSWNVTAKLGYYQRSLIHTDINDSTLTQLCNTSEVLRVVVCQESNEFFLSNMDELLRLLQRGLASKQPQLHDTMIGILSRMFASLPSPDQTTSDEHNQSALRLFQWAETSINEGLRLFDNPSSTLIVIQAMSEYYPDRLDPYLQGLLRNMTKILREHLTAPVPQSAGIEGKTDTVRDAQYLITLLRLLSLRMSQLGDMRRYLLTSIVQILDKSTNDKVCGVVLDLLSEWIVEKTALPTPKEKAGLLFKMMSFAQRTGEFVALTHRFLRLVLLIYTDQSFARSDLTVRLEPAFLLGCRYEDPEIRRDFLTLLNNSMSSTLTTRLQYIIGIQNWEPLAAHYWISQALDLLLASTDTSKPLMDDRVIDQNKGSPRILEMFKDATVGHIINPLRQLLYRDASAAHEIWITIFQAAWSTLKKSDHLVLSRQLIGLLSKSYHYQQVQQRPNVVQTLLAGLTRCHPAAQMPPHLIKYIGKTFEGWFDAIEFLTASLENQDQPEAHREHAQDALAELYADLLEEDHFYGLWRRRSLYDETNAALSFEQNGLWPEAQSLYEKAQAKARAGALPFSESEYTLWEDHWVTCAQKLQQWDLLTDLARHEGNMDLLLECAWRNGNWAEDHNTLKEAFDSLNEDETPRRFIFNAYLALVKGTEEPASFQNFEQILTDAKQLSLRKWHLLPSVPGPVHVPMLHVFQQFVELNEARSIFATFGDTRAENLDQRSSELKNTLQTWRERLPNQWDDINLWSDLVAWRTQVFQAVNKVYLPLVNSIHSAQGGHVQSSGANSFGYRGFHEMAWTINRFAHTARKHQIQEVCIKSLTKIYTLPNIEIQEAFLKLREQARCLLQSSEDVASGLEVINNTNLLFFSASQKAEFFTLKGMFSARLGLDEDATNAFNQAVQTDLNMPKGWTEWGRYNDASFKASPDNYSLAANAVSCYVQAAGLYKSSKSRKLLGKVLWLLSLDDPAGTISRAFESYNGETPVWYWITFIPQLLLSLTHRDARHARGLLIQIARKYPQSLFFQLRTTKEEYEENERRMRAAADRAKIGSQSTDNTSVEEKNRPRESHQEQGQDVDGRPTRPFEPTTLPPNQLSFGGTDGRGPHPSPSPSKRPLMNGQGAAPSVTGDSQASVSDSSNLPRPPLEYVEEILTMLKTAYPLLTLSLETMVDQISQRSKPIVEEEAYRMISVLLSDAIQQYARRSPESGDDLKIAPNTRATLEGVSSNPLLGSAFAEDLLKEQDIHLPQMIAKLRRWRARFESLLESRPRTQHLQSSRRHLAEFHHTKYDAVYIPGQYLRHEDDDGAFLQIVRFSPKIEFFRGHSQFFKRLTFIAPNGLSRPFHVHLPTPRSCRREEALQQLFRIFNAVLARRKESRQRGLNFTLAAAVPLSPSIRLVESDSSMLSIDHVFEKHCKNAGIDRLEAVISWIEKLATLWRAKANRDTVGVNMKMDLMAEIQSKVCPVNILSNFVSKSAVTSGNLWQLKKQMTLQYATLIFLTYVMSLSKRDPHRILFSRGTGLMQTTDMFSSFSLTEAIMENNEAVPFRLTPNLQHLFGAIGVEGVLTTSVMSIGRCLTQPQFDLESQLPLFMREDVLTWYGAKKRNASEHEIRRMIQTNAQRIVARAQILAHKYEREQGANETATVEPACLSLINLINQATNPQILSQMEPLFAPWF